MKVGLIPCNVGVNDVESIVLLAKTAERIGLESLWTFEHAIVPVDYESPYPYSADGKMPATPETNFVDPLITLATIAAHTERLRLGTGVNILPQVNPLMLAKQPFAVNILSRAQEQISANCGGEKWGEERFSEGTWEAHADGPPVLQDAQAVLICSSDGFLDYGSHGIFVGRIIDVAVDEGLDPLIYVNGAYTSACD